MKEHKPNSKRGFMLMAIFESAAIHFLDHFQRKTFNMYVRKYRTIMINASLNIGTKFLAFDMIMLRRAP